MAKDNLGLEFLFRFVWQEEASHSSISLTISISSLPKGANRIDKNKKINPQSKAFL